ncbi:MAG TPA: hypothetical protein VN969_13540 [Streptosporangiaceae bacterium]|nr:hypothetical protein [Streptosporangiaceae bacterium]
MIPLGLRLVISGGRDTFNGQQINRFDVAATGASSPVPPGMTRDPGPGQYYASPALAALLRSTPAGQLADRYPGHLAGTIGNTALPSPDSLVIIVGRIPAEPQGAELYPAQPARRDEHH